MSLRDLDRVVRASARGHKRDIEKQYLILAAPTCEIVNMIGGAYSSEKNPWQTMTPTMFFEAWTGTSTKPVIDQDYIEAVITGIKDREASVMFMGQEN